MSVVVLFGGAVLRVGWGVSLFRGLGDGRLPRGELATRGEDENFIRVAWTGRPHTNLRPTFYRKWGWKPIIARRLRENRFWSSRLRRVEYIREEGEAQPRCQHRAALRRISSNWSRRSENPRVSKKRTELSQMRWKDLLLRIHLPSIIYIIIIGRLAQKLYIITGYIFEEDNCTAGSHKKENERAGRPLIVCRNVRPRRLFRLHQSSGALCIN